MKTAEDFLNEINEKSWRANIKAEANRKFEQLIDGLNENKEAILDEIISDIKTMEKIKLDEENQAFNYSIFQTWLDYCARSVITNKIREDDE